MVIIQLLILSTKRYFYPQLLIQGGQLSGNQGNQGKVREFVFASKSQGKVREFEKKLLKSGKMQIRSGKNFRIRFCHFSII